MCDPVCVCVCVYVCAYTGIGSGTRRFTQTPDWLSSGGTLHPYQLEGLNWLFHKYKSHENVVLADEVRNDT